MPKMNMFWGNFFVPKGCPNVFWTCFEHVLGYFFRKFFLPSVDQSSKHFQKIKSFQNSKNAQNRSQIVVFWTCFEVIFFENSFCPVFHGGSSLRNVFKKIKKFSKFQKCPKSFPKLSKRVLNMFWGNFFENAQCSMEGRVFEMFL